MDKILITYRGGYGDIHSILSSFSIKKNQEITFLVEEDHVFLKNIYPWVKFIKNPIYTLYTNNIFFDKIKEHREIKESKNFDQKKYDESIIEVAFYMWIKYEPYFNFYKNLIKNHDLIITNYLDITCIENCKILNKEWWLVKSWNDWQKDSYFLNMLNSSSPYRNIYYYEKEWIKDYETETNGDYKYRDSNIYKFNINENQERFKLNFKVNNKKKVFFATLGSMSRDNLNMGRMVHKLFLKKINELFMDDWYGITTEREYNAFIKEKTEDRWVFLTPAWYSHDLVLDYSQLFLTHGGAGSFARGIHKNKKMIVFPFQLDQFYFADIIKKHYDGEIII